MSDTNPVVIIYLILINSSSAKDMGIYNGKLQCLDFKALFNLQFYFMFSVDKHKWECCFLSYSQTNALNLRYLRSSFDTMY